ncbi:MAG: class I SAM-dependent methyltransferase [Candidatus Omnitrophica bacterium]|nr:class I SAM-dependent methyltransferase [Candidatus Omnitrophota bacterium]
MRGETSHKRSSSEEIRIREARAMDAGKSSTVPAKCELCDASIRKPSIIGNDVYGGSADQKFYRCPHCDVAFLYPRMSEKDEKRFYAQEFERFMEKRAGKDFDWRGPEAHIQSNQKQYARRLPFFEELLSPSLSVLEVGCSSGFMLLPLKERGLDVVGIEPSGGFSGFLKQKGIDVYSSMQDLKDSAVDVKEFDLVMHFFVLEHMRDPVKFMRDTLGFLKPGGVMICEVPSRSDPLLTIYNIPAFHKFYWSVAHNYYFNRPSLEYVLYQVCDDFEILPEQRYDISNHMTWALEGKPGGQGKYTSFFTPELESSYLESMKRTGHCDTMVVRICKKG